MSPYAVPHKSLYGYDESQVNRYELTRDGATVHVGTEQECWAFIHARHSYSVDWALRYEGYRMTPVVPS